jgi:hypothetical protein
MSEFQIRPYPRTATYPTGWAGCLTFEQLYDDLIPNLNRPLRYYRSADIDLPDLIAHAFMRLWLNLSADPNFLAHEDRGGTLKLLVNRANVQVYRKLYECEIYLEDFATRSRDPDEFIIDGLDRGHGVGHAAYAEAGAARRPRRR